MKALEMRSKMMEASYRNTGAKRCADTGKETGLALCE